MGYSLQPDVAPRNRGPASSFRTPKTLTCGPRLQQRGRRYYSPELGRWLSRDPAAESGGGNLYALVANTTVNAIDYLGLIQVLVGGFSASGPDPRWTGYVDAIMGNISAVAARINSGGWKDRYGEPCKLNVMWTMALSDMSKFVWSGTNPEADYGFLWTKFIGSPVTGDGSIIGPNTQSQVMAAKSPRCKWNWAGSWVGKRLQDMGVYVSAESWLRTQTGNQMQAASALFILGGIRDVFDAYKCCRTVNGESEKLKINYTGGGLHELPHIREYGVGCKECPDKEGDFKCLL